MSTIDAPTADLLLALAAEHGDPPDPAPADGVRIVRRGNHRDRLGGGCRAVGVDPTVEAGEEELRKRAVERATYFLCEIASAVVCLAADDDLECSTIDLPQTKALHDAIVAAGGVSTARDPWERRGRWDVCHSALISVCGVRISACYWRPATEAEIAAAAEMIRNGEVER